MIVKFYDQVEDEKLKFAVIAARAEGKWVFCKHKARTTLEMPAVIESRVSRSWTRPGGNCRRRPAPPPLICNRCACIP